MSEINLIVDTNLFIQGKPLNEISWNDDFSSVSTVRLIVTPPLQKEIDRSKARGNDRVGKRSRKTSSLFKQIIISGEEHVIRDANPRVVLSIRPDIKPRDGDHNDLDIETSDDQFVACVLAYCRKNPGCDARLLTHDSGPLATAQHVGAKICPIPDHWLSPPEPSAAEKKLKTLQTEVELLKSSEPVIDLLFFDGMDDPVDKLDLEILVYEPLNATRIYELMEKTSTKHPAATYFGETERRVRDCDQQWGVFQRQREEFVPATEEEIDTYQTQTYPKWFKSCRNYLESLHDHAMALAPHPCFHIAMANRGTRPASSVLVEFYTKGPLTIMPPPREDEGDNEQTIDDLKLPSMPSVPSGEWVKLSRLGMHDHLFKDVRRAHGLFSNNPAVMSPKHLIAPTALLKEAHDNNAFYYKPRRFERPKTSYSLECDQWRHGVDPKVFSGQVHLQNDDEEASGVITCRVQAENLSEPITQSIPVTIKKKRLKLDDTAAWLIEQLV